VILDADGKAWSPPPTDEDAFLADTYAQLEAKRRDLDRYVAGILWRETGMLLDAEGHVVWSGDVEREERSFLE
jgi:hypothetical protein